LSLAGPARKIKITDWKLKMKVDKEHGFENTIDKVVQNHNTADK